MEYINEQNASVTLGVLMNSLYKWTISSKCDGLLTNSINDNAPIATGCKDSFKVPTSFMVNSIYCG